MIGTNLAITPKSYFRGLSLDPDAQIYISAANITDTTQQSAVNQLVLDLKSIGVWTKEKALYPVLGGSASSHAVNLKTPGTYNLTFATGWTHASTGMTPNGATYADTNFNPILTSQSLTSTHLSVYTRAANSIGTSRGYIGSIQTDLINYTALGFFSGGTVEIGVIGGASVDYTGNLAPYSGFKLTSTSGSRLNTYYKNGSKQGSSIAQTNNFYNANFYLGAINYIATAAYFQNVPFAFASIGDGLTDAEALNKTVAVQKYQRALGRAVDMEIQVGTGATRSYYTPFSTLDNYSISGNIYLQSEVIGAAIPMLGIEMYFSGFTLPYSLVNQEIYLAHVTQSQFDSAPAVDFSDLTLSNLTLVKASFTFTAANNAWVRMNFDTPFQYNGTSNILVIWKNNRGTWSSGGGGSDTHTSTSRSMYKVGSTGQPTGNGTLTNSRSNIKFIW